MQKRRQLGVDATTVWSSVRHSAVQLNALSEAIGGEARKPCRGGERPIVGAMVPRTSIFTSS